MSFNLETFVDQYIEDAGKWSYLYYRTFFEMKELLDEPIDITQFFVKEVSVSEMLSIIEAKVGINWFVNRMNGAALIREVENGYELFYRGERGGSGQVIATNSNLKEIVLLKLRKDLFWIDVQNIKD